MNELTEQNQKQVCEIIPHLYLGSWLATRPIILKTLQINTVISIGADPYSAYLKDIQYLKHDFDDNSQSVNQLLEAIQDILPLMHNHITQNRNVLIHCSAGKSRSVSVAIAYLKQYHKFTVEQALDHIQLQRSCVNPNEFFLEALKNKFLPNDNSIDNEVIRI